MKQRVEKYIPAAIEAITTEKITKDNGKIDKQFKGYISSFGAAIIQTGLIPAVAFYSVQGDADAERQKLIEAIKKILTDNVEVIPNTQSLLRFLIERFESNDNMNLWKEKIMDAATALKLAVRTFEMDD